MSKSTNNLSEFSRNYKSQIQEQLQLNAQEHVNEYLTSVGQPPLIGEVEMDGNWHHASKDGKVTYQFHLNYKDGIPTSVLLIGDFKSGKPPTKILDELKAAREIFNEYNDSGIKPTLKSAPKPETTNNLITPPEPKKDDRQQLLHAFYHRFKEGSEGESPYLQAKGLAHVKCPSIRKGDILTAFKLIDTQGKDQSIQKVYHQPNAKGKINKYNAAGTNIKKCFFLAGTGNIKDFLRKDKWNFAEGVADALTIYDALNKPVIGVLGAEFLESIAGELIAKATALNIDTKDKIVIWGHDDSKKHGQKNPGLTNANKTVAKYGGQIIAPPLSQDELKSGMTDWNDIYKNRSKEVIRSMFEQLNNPLTDIQRKEGDNSRLFYVNPNGYYSSAIGCLDNELLSKKTIVLDGECGVGKTSAVASLIKNSPETKVLAVTPNVILTEHLALKFGLESYKDLQKNGNALSSARRQAICLNSLAKMYKEEEHINRPEILVLEEFSITMDYMARGGHILQICIVWIVLRTLIKHSQMVIICDASINKHTIKLIKDLRPDAEFEKCSNPKKPGRKTPLKIYENKSDALEAIKTKMLNGLSVFVPVTTRKQAKCVYDEFINDPQLKDKDIVLATSHTSNEEATKKIIESPTEAAEKIDCLISTAVIGSGVSFNSGAFDETVGIISGSVYGTQAAKQHLSRARQPKKLSIHIYSAQKNELYEDELTLQKIGAQKESELRQTVLSRLGAIDLVMHNDEIKKVTHKELDKWADSDAELFLKDRSNFEKNLISTLQDAGYEPSFIKCELSKKEQTAKEKIITERYHQGEIKNLIAAKGVTGSEYLNDYKNSEKLTAQQYVERDRFKLEKKFGVKDLKQIKITDENHQVQATLMPKDYIPILYTSERQGIGKTAIEALEQVTKTPEEHLKLVEYINDRELRPTKHVCCKYEVFEMVFEALNIKRCNESNELICPDRDFGAKDDEIIKLSNKMHDYMGGQDLRAIKLPTLKEDPIKWIGCVLKRIGLKIKISNRSRTERRYTINKRSVSLMNKILRARKNGFKLELSIDDLCYLKQDSEKNGDTSAQSIYINSSGNVTANKFGDTSEQSIYIKKSGNVTKAQKIKPKVIESSHTNDPLPLYSCWDMTLDQSNNVDSDGQSNYQEYFASINPSELENVHGKHAQGLGEA